MKSSRHPSRGEARRLGNVALIAFMLGSLLVLSVVGARFCPIGKAEDAIEAEEKQAILRKGSVKVAVKVETADEEAASSAAEEVDEEEEPPQTKPRDTSTVAVGKGSARGAASSSSVAAGKGTSGGSASRSSVAARKGTGGGVAAGKGTSRSSVAARKSPVAAEKVSRSSVAASTSSVVTTLEINEAAACFETSQRSDTCEAAGDVRVVGVSGTVHVSPLEREWKVKPYPRKTDAFALSHVREWTLRPLDPASAPRCTVNSSASTAFVLSTGGFAGNLFHDYTDVLVPAFITARRFNGDVQFLVSSHKSWWTSRYAPVLQQLSAHDVVDADADEEVRCYRGVVVGPRFHRELGVDPARTPGGRFSMPDFRASLRAAFALDRAVAAPSGDRWDVRRRPRLLILSRGGSRRFLNERWMADMAGSLGFDVRVADPTATADVSRFARLVNSADVMVGVHGSGLANMVFLPVGAVLVQVVPYGGLEWLARGTFGEPCADMGLHYLEYRIALDETSLSEQYASGDPVIRDPAAIHLKGWNAIKEVYLDKQNVKPHLGRLKSTFEEALKLLPHGRKDTDN